MLHFETGRALVLSGDLRSMLADMDRAYLSGLRAAGTIIETFDGAGLPAAQAQKVHVKMLEGLTRMVEGRGDMVGVMGRLQVLKSHSNIAETDVGCPWGWEDMVAATETPERALS